MTDSRSRIAQALDDAISTAATAAQALPHSGLTEESAAPIVEAQVTGKIAGPLLSALGRALLPLYVAAWAAGEAAADEALSRRRGLTKADDEISGNAAYQDTEPLTPEQFVTEFGIDWSTWTAGDLRSARITYGAGLKRLLDEALGNSSEWTSRAANRGSILASIADVRLDKLGQVIAQALSTGESVQTLGKDLADVLDVPTWSGLVANTETARAMTAATVQTYVEHEVPGKEFLTAEDDRVCPDCDVNEEEGPVPLAESFTNGDPPVHPACRCALLPVLAEDDSADDQQEDQ